MKISDDRLSPSKVIVPMVSPFNTDYSIDQGAVKSICENFVRYGVSVFALGTTGEGDSMSVQQKDTLLQYIVSETKGKIKIYAGLTGNSLYQSIEDARKYADMGAEFLVTKLPSYYPIGEDQMLHYFETLADSVQVPLYLYNIPSTTHHSIPLPLLEKLSYHPHIAGTKDSARDVSRMDESLRLWGNRDDFEFLIGWAAMSVYGLSKGAHGIVPSTANFDPELYTRMIESVRAGDEPGSLQLQETTNRISAIYQEGMTLSQSIPALKVLMKTKGLCNGNVLPPMLKMSAQVEAQFVSKIQDELKKLDLP